MLGTQPENALADLAVQADVRRLQSHIPICASGVHLLPRDNSQAGIRVVLHTYDEELALFGYDSVKLAGQLAGLCVNCHRLSVYQHQWRPLFWT